MAHQTIRRTYVIYIRERTVYRSKPLTRCSPFSPVIPPSQLMLAHAQSRPANLRTPNCHLNDPSYSVDTSDRLRLLVNCDFNPPSNLKLVDYRHLKQWYTYQLHKDQTACQSVGSTLVVITQGGISREKEKLDDGIVDLI